MELYAFLQRNMTALEQVRAFRADSPNAGRDRDALEMETRLTRLNGTLGSLLRIVEGADVVEKVRGIELAAHPKYPSREGDVTPVEPQGDPISPQRR